MKKMQVKEYGRGENVMLLHGGGLSWWSCRDAAEILAKDYRVLLPVLDGHGAEPFTSIGDCAQRLLGLIDSRCGGKIAALGGLSLGGQVALEMLSRRPDLCRTALIESACVIPDSLTAAMIAPALNMSFGLIQRRWFAQWQFASLRLPEHLFEEYFEDTHLLRKTDMSAFMRASSLYALPDNLSEVRAKVRVVAGGAESGRIRLSAREIAGAVPGSRLSILPGMHHGELSISRPELYARMLTE